MKTIAIRIAGACLAVFFGFAVVAAGEKMDRVAAKIGIQIKSGGETFRAKARNRVVAGDYIRVCVHPQEDAWVYVVHTDDATATLLNMTLQKVQSTLLCLPSMYAFYKVDGGSAMEKITIVCSPTELPRLTGMIDRPLPADRWAAIEEDLIARGEIHLAGKGEGPFGIAGNVRGAETLDAGDPFIQDMPIYSGKGLLAKTYAFMVQN